MIRLFMVVEGQTEEQFAKTVLSPYLASRGVLTVPIIVTTRRDRAGRKIGRGGGHWKFWRKDLRRLLGEHPGKQARFTTLFDLYGLPIDFPQLRQYEKEPDTVRRAEFLEAAMAQEFGNDYRLIPYLQRHEFEALVLVGLDVLESLLDEDEDLQGLKRLRDSVADLSPEDVDDGKETAPSKRLQAHIPSYQKTVHGPLAAEEVGLTALRRACPRFDRWVGTLERLAPD